MKSRLCKYTILLCMLLFLVFALFTACKDDEQGSTISYSYDTSLNEIESTEAEESSTVSGDSTDGTSESVIIPNESIVGGNSSEGGEISMLPDDSSDNTNSGENEDSASTGAGDSSGEGDSNSSSSENGDGTSDSGDTEGDFLPEHELVYERKEPTCTEIGYEKEWCSICGTPNFYKEIPALGHTPTTVSGFLPNCKTEGQTEKEYCSVCNETLKEAETIPIVDHDYILGSCRWCDLSLLRYEIRKEPNGLCYAVCMGAEIFTPYSAVRFIEIPSRITCKDEDRGVTYECPVTEIAGNAFLEHYELNSVIIGENVEKIGEFAFGRCYNLKEVYDKSKLRVGELDHLHNGSITTYVNDEDIHYEEYQSKIAIDEESGCITYTDNNVTELIGIRDVRAHVIIPEGVTKINGYVFYKTRVVYKLTIASTVNWIDRYAFYYNCDTHPKSALEAKEGHRPEDCDIHIKEIVMLNRNGWRLYEDYNNQTRFIELDPEQLNNKYQLAWNLLVVDYYEYYWLREE